MGLCLMNKRRVRVLNLGFEVKRIFTLWLNWVHQPFIDHLIACQNKVIAHTGRLFSVQFNKETGDARG